MSYQDNFNSFMELVSQDNLFRRAINRQSKGMDVNPRYLLKSNPKNIKHERQYLLLKQIQSSKQDHMEWSQPQKKLFNWILLCYLHLHKTTVSHLTDQDCQELSQLTTNKCIPQVRFQACSIMKQHRPGWSQEEDQILLRILKIEKKFEAVGMWCQVSKELFLRGDLRVYKSGKQCRERWFNFVNPELNKNWTDGEDLILMKNIRQIGKKWAQIIPLLNGTKSEHMIKNRYHSLLRKKQHDFEHQKQDNLVNIVIGDINQKLHKESQKKKTVKSKTSLKSKSSKGQENNLRLTRRTSQIIQEKDEKQDMFVVTSPMVPKFLGLEKQPSLNWLQSNIFKKHSEYQAQNITPRYDFKLNQSTKFGRLSSPLPPTPCAFGDQLGFKNNFNSFMTNIRKE